MPLGLACATVRRLGERERPRWGGAIAAAAAAVARVMRIGRMMGSCMVRIDEGKRGRLSLL